MSNSFLAPKVFANAGLKFLKNNLVLAKLCDSEGVEKTFDPGSGTGLTVYVKRPPEFIVRDGRTASAQDIIEGEVAVNLDKQKGIDWAYSSVEETLQVSKLLKSKSLNNAMATLASQIDLDLMDQTLEYPNWVGTAGNTVTSPTQFFAAPQRLDELAVPDTDRYAVMTPADGYGVAGSLLSNAAQDGEVATSALKKARVPIIGNTEPYMTQTVRTLTCGTRTNGTVAGAGQNVTFLSVRSNYQQTLNVAGLGAASTVKRGEVFTMAGVFAVNPRTKDTLPYLAQFVNLADATADGAGAVTLTIANPIITTGAYQNVSAAPANGAAVTWKGTASTSYPQNTAFHATSLKLVSAKMIMPYTGEASFATDPDTGLTIRYWRYSDGASDTHNHRFDVIYGVKNTDRRLGTRFSGS